MAKAYTVSDGKLVLTLTALVPLVAVFARVELRRVASPSVSAERAGVAAVLVAVGMAFLAKKGFVNPGMPMGLPFVGVGLLVGGRALLRRV